MAQTILLFRINRDKYTVIQNVCRTLGIRIIDVARKDYFQKLGTLAQIQGFTWQNIKRRVWNQLH